jgi:RNA polymerase sigma factor (sigma-70 family)
MGGERRVMFGLAFARVLAFADAAPRSSASTGSHRLSGRRHSASSASRPDSHQLKESVYRRLFDENWPLVRHHLDCFLDDPDEVDEMTAEVFVVAWRKLDPARPMGRPWFLRTANNKLRDRTRRARSRDRAIEALTRGLENPTEPLDPMERLALRAAVASLNARERQVVVLTYWDELSAGQIAEVLRTTEGAVWTTLTRARGKLRRELEGDR